MKTKNTPANKSARALSRISELDTGETEDYLEPKDMLERAVEHVTLEKNKEKRENWILKNFFSHYNRLNLENFEWTTRGKPPGEPDYLVFSQPDSEPLFVEVTELLDKGRKRSDEYKAALEEARVTGDYSAASFAPPPPAGYEEQLAEQASCVLKQKFFKPYPIGTWLIVYFNPTSFTPGWTSSPESETLGFARKILAKAISALEPPHKIEEVWVLTNDGRIDRVL